MDSTLTYTHTHTHTHTRTHAHRTRFIRGTFWKRPWDTGISFGCL